jgi:hypothetical protein
MNDFDSHDPHATLATVSEYVADQLFAEASPLIGAGCGARISLWRNRETNEAVAVKQIRKESFEDPHLFLEIGPLVNLNHPCVLWIVGFALRGKSTMPEIHTVYAESGSLANVLEGARRGIVPSFWNTTGKCITTYMRDSSWNDICAFTAICGHQQS